MAGVRPFVVLGLSLILGLAVFGHQVNRAVRQGRDFDRYLSVKGLSEREAKATLAIWPICFAVTADNLTALRSEMESNSSLVFAFLKDHGIDSKEITQGLPAVTDREDERIQSNHPALPRYRAVVTLAIRSKNVDTIKKAIQSADSLLAKGVTLTADGGQPQFIFDALNSVKPGMIREATANARASAEKFARDSRSRVGGIRKATQGVIEIEDRDAASPEWKTLRVVTTVDFFLE